MKILSGLKGPKLRVLVSGLYRDYQGSFLGPFDMVTNAVLLLGPEASVSRHFCHDLLQTEVGQGTGVPPVVRVDSSTLHPAGILVC
jgi:hypothetical protein